MLHPVDTGRKLNVPKASWTSSERLMYIQFTSCVYWVQNGCSKIGKILGKSLCRSPV